MGAGLPLPGEEAPGQLELGLAPGDVQEAGAEGRDPGSVVAGRGAAGEEPVEVLERRRLDQDDVLEAPGEPRRGRDHRPVGEGQPTGRGCTLERRACGLAGAS